MSSGWLIRAGVQFSYGDWEETLRAFWDICAHERAPACTSLLNHGSVGRVRTSLQIAMWSVIVLWVAISCLSSPLIGLMLAKRLSPSERWCMDDWNNKAAAYRARAHARRRAEKSRRRVPTPRASTGKMISAEGAIKAAAVPIPETEEDRCG